MPKFRKIKLALAFLSLFALISTVQKTYMKYNSSAFGDASISIARWQIVINGQDVIENSFLSNTISPTILSNSHVKEGVIAPRSVGFFDIVIDYSNVDTSFELNLITSLPDDALVKDLLVTGYSEDGGTIVPVETQINNLSKTIYLSDSLKVKSYRIYITWEDSSTEEMDNAADTEAALSGNKAALNVLLNFKQITD